MKPKHVPWLGRYIVAFMPTRDPLAANDKRLDVVGRFSTWCGAGFCLAMIDETVPFTGDNYRGMLLVS